MAVVLPEERAAAGGVPNVARTLGAAMSPLFVGLMFASPSMISVPFFFAGTLKIAYDVLLYRQFVRFSRGRRSSDNEFGAVPTILTVTRQNGASRANGSQVA